MKEFFNCFLIVLFCERIYFLFCFVGEFLVCGRIFLFCFLFFFFFFFFFWKLLSFGEMP